MKLKKGVEPFWSDDVYYDLFDGGYLSPEKFLSNEKDIQKVKDAIALIEEYLELVVVDEEEVEDE